MNYMVKALDYAKHRACQRVKISWLPFYLSNLPKFLFNYPQYQAKRDERLQAKFDYINQNYKQSSDEIKTYIKDFVKSDANWHVKEEGNYQFLTKRFIFSSDKDALLFINKIQPICDEMNHHPNWQLSGRFLSVNLTTHDLKNRLSDKDYELAAVMNREYESIDNYDQYVKQKTLYIYSMNFLIGAAIVGGFLLIYELKSKHRFTSMDFIFPKIRLPSNKTFYDTTHDTE